MSVYKRVGNFGQNFSSTFKKYVKKLVVEKYAKNCQI